MNRVISVWVVVVLTGVITNGAWGQSAPASQPAASQPVSQPASQPGSQPTTAPQPINRTDLAVTVDGHQILEGAVDDIIRERYPKLVQGGGFQAQATLSIARDQLREELINDWLLDREIEKAHLTVSDEEVAEFAENEARGTMSLNGWTRDELDAKFRREQQITLDQFIAKRKVDAPRRAWLLRNKLLRQTFGEQIRATDEKVREFYDQRVDLRFKRPEQVRASRILIRTEGLNDEERAAARKKAEQVLAEVRQPGADFAVLALKYSECLTKEKRGDVGYITQQDSKDVRFAEAAFKLKVGEISDLVETKQGYDIIKVTERREPMVIPFEQAKEGSRLMLEDQQLRKVRADYCEELRKAAKIEYPPGKPPRGSPNPTGPVSPGQAPPPKTGGK